MICARSVRGKSPVEHTATHHDLPTTFPTFNSPSIDSPSSQSIVRPPPPSSRRIEEWLEDKPENDGEDEEDQEKRLPNSPSAAPCRRCMPNTPCCCLGWSSRSERCAHTCRGVVVIVVAFFSGCFPTVRVLSTGVMENKILKPSTLKMAHHTKTQQATHCTEREAACSKV